MAENTIGDGDRSRKTVRELYEPCCEAGARVVYQNLTLRKLEWSDRGHSMWEVHREGEWIDTIDTGAFRSASELAGWLTAVAECEPPCACCEATELVPTDSVAGD